MDQMRTGTPVAIRQTAEGKTEYVRVEEGKAVQAEIDAAVAAGTEETAATIIAIERNAHRWADEEMAAKEPEEVLEACAEVQRIVQKAGNYGWPDEVRDNVIDRWMMRYM